MWQTGRKLAAAGTLAASLLLAEGALAQLTEVDLVPGSGDGRATLDAATGLYWLDLTETKGLSMPDVLGGAGGWVPSGWRYATAPEICALFAAYALAVPDCGSSEGGLVTGDVVATLQGFLGITGDAFSRVTSGLYEDAGDPALVGAAQLAYSSAFNWSTSLVQDDASLPTGFPNTGHWLLRTSPPPPPAPIPALPWRWSVVLVVVLILGAAAHLLRRSRRGDDAA